MCARHRRHFNPGHDLALARFHFTHGLQQLGAKVALGLSERLVLKGEE